MKKLAFLTMENMSETTFVSDDELIIPLLNAAGWEVILAPWSISDTNWKQFDAVVIRTPWDYTKRPTEFLATLDRIEAAGVPLVNSAAHCRWNYDKRYLLELAQKGIEIVPTILIEPPLTDEKLASAIASQEADGHILKPIIGATASDIYRLKNGEQAPEAAFTTYAEKHSLAQPFMRHIVEEGEFSLHYFGGKFSHAILKSPRKGDFRVQEEWGGVPVKIVPEPALVEAGNRVMASLPEGLLYARVDLVRTENNTFALMEAEIIEPALYFRTDPAAPERFVRAFTQWAN